MNLGRRQFSLGLCGCSALAACVTDSLSKPAVPGERLQAETPLRYRPDIATDEGGLWAMFDKVEAETKSSRFLVRDAELNAYVKEIACRLAGDHCPDMRVYITRTPYFNASMAPNGMMSIWTGLLLRAQNEAQLAAIIGHEIGHYMRRHSVQRFRDIRAKADFAAFLSMGLAVAGMGALGNVSQLLILASIFAYSREHEREADAYGLDLMADAGYEPMEASKVWEQLIEEQKAKENQTPRDIVFASHPAPEERLITLREHAQRRKAGSASRFDIHRERFLDNVHDAREWMLRDEVRLRQYGPSLALFDQLLAGDPDAGDIAFARGEVFRLRDREGDAAKAAEVFEMAVQMKRAPPPEAYRSLGFLHRRAGNFEKAKPAFERYLELRPGAEDRSEIKDYLDKTGQKT